MAAQTVTRNLGASTVAWLANLQREIAGSAPVDIAGNATTTVTIVHTTATGAITVDYAAT